MNMSYLMSQWGSVVSIGRTHRDWIRLGNDWSSDTVLRVCVKSWGNNMLGGRKLTWEIWSLLGCRHETLTCFVFNTKSSSLGFIWILHWESGILPLCCIGPQGNSLVLTADLIVAVIKNTERWIEKKSR